MESTSHSLQDHAIPLADLFESAPVHPSHEAANGACHAFEMYEARNAKVREAAYLRAQARGFAPGHELDDWLAAEHEVDACLFAEIAPVGFVG
ncbi:MAG TPA: DUF2934 domain-containing protein [Steroidobacteraceae bacterium]|nr:DUF2934 domain-containing protein [Steroidobacteraceae bacterium]